MAAMNHETSDRAPFDLAGTVLSGMLDEFIEKMIKYCDIKCDSHDEAVEQIMQRYDIDFRHVGNVLTFESGLGDYSKMKQGHYVNCWGISYTYSGVYWEISKSPLKDATFEEVKEYPWPDASQIDKKNIDIIAEKAKSLYQDTDFVVVAGHPVYGYFELGCWLFGFDDFLYRLMIEPETVNWFFERFHKYVLDVNEIYYGKLGKYVHLTTSGDDFGTQNGPFMSPELFRKSIAPWYKKRIASVKSMCDAKYFHHSCGSVYRLLDDIIDMGVDILNPIQPGSAEMEPERLKGEYGDKIVFWGGIDEQNLLTQGTPEQVTREVRRVYEVLSKDGGYVMSPSHNVQPDVPPENIEAMYKAISF